MRTYSDDYKGNALAALKGNWKTAVLTGFLASLFGGTVISSGSGSSTRYEERVSTNDLDAFFSSQLWQDIAPVVLSVVAVLLVWTLVTIVVGGAVRLGYAKFNLKLIDHEPVQLADLFAQKHRLGPGFCMNFLISLYTFLWSLLLFIPGIIKSYAYAMTPYILAENPDMTANEAITRSREVMNGWKFDLFCLHLSFLGWDLLCAAPAALLLLWAILRVDAGMMGWSALWWVLPLSLVLTAGYLFLRPYMEAAHAAFYRHISQNTFEVLPEA